jgi:hypothetical protein
MGMKTALKFAGPEKEIRESKSSASGIACFFVFGRLTTLL